MSPMNSETESRVEELESRLAFQDDLIEQLNAVVARQDRDFLLLSQRLKALEARISDMVESAGDGGGSAGYEPPPHY